MKNKCLNKIRLTSEDKEPRSRIKIKSRLGFSVFTVLLASLIYANDSPKWLDAYNISAWNVDREMTKAGAACALTGAINGSENVQCAVTWIWDIEPNDINVECDQVPAPQDYNVMVEFGGVIHTPIFGDNFIPGSCSGEYGLEWKWGYECPDGSMEYIQMGIHVSDNTPPTFDPYPFQVTTDCADNVSLLTAQDNCQGGVTMTFEDLVFSGACGTIERTYKVADDCGNTATTQQYITVQDNSDPVFDPYDVQIMGVCGDPITPLTATDNCSVTVTTSSVLFSGGCAGVLEVIHLATDACGNTATAIQYIKLVDNTAPIISGVPADATYPDLASVPDPGQGVTVSDECDQTPDLEFSEQVVSGICPDNTIITRTWTATDNCQNSVTETQVITVAECCESGFTTISQGTEKSVNEESKDWFFDVVATEDGGYLAAGYSRPSEIESGSAFPYIVKHDISGNEVWNYTLLDLAGQFNALRELPGPGLPYVGITQNRIVEFDKSTGAVLNSIDLPILNFPTGSYVVGAWDIEPTFNSFGEHDGYVVLGTANRSAHRQFEYGVFLRYESGSGQFTDYTYFNNSGLGEVHLFKMTQLLDATGELEGYAAVGNAYTVITQGVASNDPNLLEGDAYVVAVDRNLQPLWETTFAEDDLTSQVGYVDNSNETMSCTNCGDGNQESNWAYGYDIAQIRTVDNSSNGHLVLSVGLDHRLCFQNCGGFTQRYTFMDGTIVSVNDDDGTVQWASDIGTFEGVDFAAPIEVKNACNAGTDFEILVSSVNKNAAGKSVGQIITTDMFGNVTSSVLNSITEAASTGDCVFGSAITLDGGIVLSGNNNKPHTMQGGNEDDSFIIRTDCSLCTENRQASISHDQAKSEELTIYPNPTSDQLIIELPSIELLSENMSIHDATGKLVWTGNVQGMIRLDVSTWDNGVYHIMHRNKAYQIVVAQ